MGNQENYPKADINVSYTFSSIMNITYSISSILGNFNSEIINGFYPKLISKRVNIIISELVNNVIDYMAINKSGIVLKMKVISDKVIIQVSNKVRYKQYLKVKKHIEEINKSKDIKYLFYETIKKRRSNGLKGGLGLIRLVSENKSSLNVNYNKNNSIMTITSKFNLKDNAI